MEENWKPIPGYEGLYEVSDLGRVKALEKKRRVGISNSFRSYPETIMRERTEKQKYKSVKLCHYGKYKRMKVHQLVAMAFLNHVPDGHSIVVDHKDNIRSNNRLSNLQLITQRKNSSRKAKGVSKRTGVCFRKDNQTWTTSFGIGYYSIYIGQFKEEETAAEYYQNALKSFENKEPIKIYRTKTGDEFISPEVYLAQSK